MKFVCDSCNTKYSIADERVHGRVLKIRCKTCDHVITVREEMKPPDPAPAAIADLGRNLSDAGDDHTMVSMAPPAPSAEALDEWYVSFDGDQEGPFTLKQAVERVRSERPGGKEAHAWRPGFFVWLAVEEIPEFAPALERARKSSAPPPMPAAPAVRPQGAVKSPSGSQPALSSKPSKSSTGPQPVQSAPSLVKPAAVAPLLPPMPAVPPLVPSLAPIAGLEPLPPVDSKPMALPPPPEALKDLPLNLPMPSTPGPMPLMGMDSMPSLLDSMPAVPGPMAAQLTKPEPRLARRALEGDDHKHESKPQPKIPATPTQSSPSLPSSPLSSLPTREPSAPEISPFAAALAAATGKEPKQHDTGPVPLPPPPGDDLAIGEPSGLLSIAHFSGAQLTGGGSSLAARPSGDKQVIDTFGGVAVTPPGQNGTSSAPPVVVVAGPAQGAATWVKWSVAGLLLVVVGLIGAVIYLVAQRPVTPPSTGAPVAAPNKHLDDSPIQGVAEPAPAVSIGQGTPDPKKPQPPKHVGIGPKPPLVATPGQKPAVLSAEQQKLAALYGEGGDKATPKDTAMGDRGEKSQGQVSQTSILAVVTQNRRALNTCYDRVLKHDTTLKRARLVTHVKVGLSGSVTAVTIPDPTYSDSEIGQCLVQTIKHWHFPAADGEYETEFPIILQAE